MVANALSCMPEDGEGSFKTIATVLTISMDPKLSRNIRDGYSSDTFCQKVLDNLDSFPNTKVINRLIYIGSRLVVPQVGTIHEDLFQAAHHNLGHFGAEKSYASLQSAYYWPQMQTELEGAYVPGCDECQRNKGSTKQPMRPLHPLLVPDAQGNSVAMDFISPLPEDEGFDCIVTMTD